MRLEQVTLAFDQLLGTIFMNGWADETMSAKLWRCRNDKLIYKMIQRTLDFFIPNHCERAYQNELKRVQMPREYR